MGFNVNEFVQFLLGFRYNMKTHCNTHHKDQSAPKNYKCLICAESFNRRDKLNEHLKLMHEAAIETMPTALKVD